MSPLFHGHCLFLFHRLCSLLLFPHLDIQLKDQFSTANDDMMCLIWQQGLYVMLEPETLSLQQSTAIVDKHVCVNRILVQEVMVK
ncbi:hypothetical protein HN51_070902 [Arachis hypogaea]